MALIAPRLQEGELQLIAPGMPLLIVALPQAHAAATLTVQVWRDQLEALSMGAAAEQWISDYLGLAARLVLFHPERERKVSPQWTHGVDAITQFSDGFPFLVTNEASLARLNAQLSAKGALPVPMDRFRANIVLSGLDAFEEDRIDTIRIGVKPNAIVLRLVKSCTRCPIPTIDQTTAQRDAHHPREPLDTLAALREARGHKGEITFGQNAILLSGEGAFVELGQSADYTLRL
jgi:uncharacterized protein YcbX